MILRELARLLLNVILTLLILAMTGAVGRFCWMSFKLGWELGGGELWP